MLVSHASTARSCDDPRLPSDDQLSRDVRIAIDELGIPMYASDAPNRFGTRALANTVSSEVRLSDPPYRADPAATTFDETSWIPPEIAPPPNPRTRDCENDENRSES